MMKVAFLRNLFHGEVLQLVYCRKRKQDYPYSTLILSITNNGKTKVDIMKTPTINTEILNEAIRELENALHETELDKYHDN